MMSKKTCVCVALVAVLFAVAYTATIPEILTFLTKLCSGATTPQAAMGLVECTQKQAKDIANVDLTPLFTCFGDDKEAAANAINQYCIDPSNPTKAVTPTQYTCLETKAKDLVKDVTADQLKQILDKCGKSP